VSLPCLGGCAQQGAVGLQSQIISLFAGALPGRQAYADLGRCDGVRGRGDARSIAGRRYSYPSTFFYFSPITKRMIFSLFSLKSLSIWPTLMTDLLLHILLHILICDAVQKVRPLTLYSTKNSN
jgi:hypothetical protein